MRRLRKVWVLGIALSVLLTGSLAFAAGKGNEGHSQAAKGNASKKAAKAKWSSGMPPGAYQGQKKGRTDTAPRGWGKGQKKGWGDGNPYPKGIGKKQQ